MNKIIIIIVLLFITYSTNYSQWKEYTIGGTITIGQFTINPVFRDIVYAAQHNQSWFYWSTNRGETWDSVHVFEQVKNFGANIKSIIVNPNNRNEILIAPTYEPSPICRSTDGGKTWKAVYEGAFVNSESMIYHPLQPNYVFAAINDVGQVNKRHGYVLRSTDSGITWDTVARVREQFEMDFTCGIDVNVKTGYIFVGGHGGKIIRSTDMGTTWSVVLKHDSGYTENKVPMIRFSKKNPDIGFATHRVPNEVRPAGGLWKTTDGGTTWNLLEKFANTSMWALDVLDVGNDIEVACANFGQYRKNTIIWHSNDAGNTWKELPKINYSYPFPDSIYPLEIETIKLTPRTTKYGKRSMFVVTSGLGLYSYEELLGDVALSDDESITDSDVRISITTQGEVQIRSKHEHLTNSFMVYDMLGREVVGNKILNGLMEETIPMPELTTGMYLFVVRTVHGNVSLPVIIDN
ncbi:MAG: hypothetical protein K1X91_01010 [Bacteriodetes bacterium]|nr:hypothetical protein [Bacteroidota bacterium]